METSSIISRGTVALFKTDSTETDPYVEILKNAGISVITIPTLEYKYINEDALNNHLLHPDDYDGIVFTSQRAVQSIQHLSKNKGFDLSKWKEKKIYCVGEATAQQASSLLQTEVLGEKTGNSDELCKFIISLDSVSTQRSLLFPCAKKRKRTIEEVLGKNGYKVNEVVCYETTCNSNLKECWTKFIIEKGLPEILVFFSPSGVEFCHQMIIETYKNYEQPKCVAIGPSTEEALVQKEMNICRTADRPNPKAVFDIILSLL